MIQPTGKMCDVHKLTTQLLELSKQLANSSKSFRIIVKTETLNFTCFSKGRDTPLETLSIKRIKKKSPNPNCDFLRRKEGSRKNGVKWRNILMQSV